MNAVMMPTEVEHRQGVLVLRRVFHAPRELVFDAWTKPEHFRQWFGPAGGSVPHCRIDLRVGGELHFAVAEAGGQTVWCKGIYQEIMPPERLVWLDYFSDEAGNITEREGFARETRIEVTFEQHAFDSTLVTVRHEPLEIDHGEIQGWKDGFDRLEALVESLK